MKVGDNIDIVSAATRRIEIEKNDSRERALRGISELRWTLPDDYKFDRDEANDR